jgi:hypothetical protein
MPKGLSSSNCLISMSFIIKSGCRGGFLGENIIDSDLLRLKSINQDFAHLCIFCKSFLRVGVTELGQSTIR